MWFFIALIAPAAYGLACVADNFLANRKFKSPLTLLFYSSLFNLIFLPLLFWFELPELPPPGTLPVFFLLGLVNAGYLYPYYRGLQTEDTSVAISFFGLGRMFVPILAFFMVGEVLDLPHYLGIALVVVSAALLGLENSPRRVRFNKALWYIGFAALLISFEGVFLKYLFERGVGVSTAVGGELFISFLLALLVLVPRTTREDVVSAAPLFRKMMPLFFLEEAFTFCAFAAESYAISMAPVGVVKGVTAAVPFFILAYAWLGRGFFPRVFKESLRKEDVARKVFLFVVLVAGIVLIKE